MSTQYLTLNTSLYHINSLVIPADAPEISSPLRNKWMLWIQVDTDLRKQGGDYKDSTKSLMSFDSIESFWGVFNHVPQPSQFILGPALGVDGLDAPINSVMLFREGVSPEWEDPINRDGGHFQFHFRLSSVEPGQLDEYWNNLVLAVIGNTIEAEGEFADTPIIQGLRFVDKRNASGRQQGLRIEVWFSRPVDARHLQKVKSKIEKTMVLRLDGTSGQGPRCDVKYHATRK